MIQHWLQKERNYRGLRWSSLATKEKNYIKLTTTISTSVGMHHMTQPFHESRLCWIHDSTPSPPRRMERTFSVPSSDSSAPISSDSSAPIPSDSSAPFPVILCALIMPQCLCITTVETRRPPLLRAAHQELLSPHLSLRNDREGEGDRLAEQPIEMQYPVQLPQ